MPKAASARDMVAHSGSCDEGAGEGAAWGFRFGPAAGLQAGVGAERTWTMIVEQGNALKDMGCQ